MLPADRPHRARRAALGSGDEVSGALRTRDGLVLRDALLAELERRGEARAWTRMLVERVALNAEQAGDALDRASARPMVLGSSGQQVAHPLWALAARLEDRVLADLKALRMTPGSVPPVVVEARDEIDELDELAPRRRRRKPSTTG